MKLATWNVNSINVRLERVLRFLERENPDFLCLQELKCTEDNFPWEALTSAGYESTVFGQKTYNGVAILSKKKPTKIKKGLGIKDFDLEARVLTAEFDTLQVVCAYVPNGQEVDSDKYRYKLKWMEEFYSMLNHSFNAKSAFLVCGDFNVAATDRDVYDPKAWKDQILFSDKEKGALNKIISLGFTDLFRFMHPVSPGFTWWDYRNLSFVKNHGLRIDLILGSKPLKESLDDIYVDKHERKGEQPSDHAPVVATFRKGNLKL